jgi:hypothetical protein
MTDSLTTALEVASEPVERKPFRETVERMRPELVKSLRDDAAVDILTRHYLTAIRLNPQLMECSQDSLLAALLLSAQVRMEPGPLGHVYLVPYKRECVWMLGYTGILELARRSERVGALAARVVWDNDEYVRPWVDEKGEHFALRPGSRGRWTCRRRALRGRVLRRRPRGRARDRGRRMSPRCGRRRVSGTRVRGCRCRPTPVMRSSMTRRC